MSPRSTSCPTIVKELGVDTDWEFDGVPSTSRATASSSSSATAARPSSSASTPEDFARRLDASLAPDRLERLPAGLAPIFERGPRQDLVGARHAT